MSIVREHKVVVTDESGDTFEAYTAELDESVDWTDDNEAVLAVVKVNSSQQVFLTRYDLTQLNEFLGEILAADQAFLDGEDGE